MEIPNEILSAQKRRERLGRRDVPSRLNPTAATLAICAATTGICWLMYGHVAIANLAMIYLLGVAAVSTLFGAREAILSSLLSIAAFNFFFVPPRFTFSVDDTQYIITFLVMLAV